MPTPHCQALAAQMLSWSFVISLVFLLAVYLAVKRKSQNICTHPTTCVPRQGCRGRDDVEVCAYTYLRHPLPIPFPLPVVSFSLFLFFKYISKSLASLCATALLLTLRRSTLLSEQHTRLPKRCKHTIVRYVECLAPAYPRPNQQLPFGTYTSTHTHIHTYTHARTHCTQHFPSGIPHTRPLRITDCKYPLPPSKITGFWILAALRPQLRGYPTP